MINQCLLPVRHALPAYFYAYALELDFLPIKRKMLLNLNRAVELKVRRQRFPSILQRCGKTFCILKGHIVLLILNIYLLILLTNNIYVYMFLIRGYNF